MVWFAHFVGGPADGDVSIVDSFSPYVVAGGEDKRALYRLARWVSGDEGVAPYSQLIYVWSEFTKEMAEVALRELESYGLRFAGVNGQHRQQRFC